MHVFVTGITNFYSRVSFQVEKAKQDDAFADISNVLGELKSMAIDMGLEIERCAILSLPRNMQHVSYQFI